MWSRPLTPPASAASAFRPSGLLVPPGARPRRRWLRAVFAPSRQPGARVQRRTRLHTQPPLGAPPQRHLRPVSRGVFEPFQLRPPCPRYVGLTRWSPHPMQHPNASSASCAARWCHRLLRLCRFRPYSTSRTSPHRQGARRGHRFQVHRRPCGRLGAALLLQTLRPRLAEWVTSLSAVSQPDKPPRAGGWSYRRRPVFSTLRTIRLRPNRSSNRRAAVFPHRLSPNPSQSAARYMASPGLLVVHAARSHDPWPAHRRYSP